MVSFNLVEVEVVDTQPVGGGKRDASMGVFLRETSEQNAPVRVQ